MFAWDRSLEARFNELFGCRCCRKQQPCLHLLLAWCQIFSDCAAARQVRDNLLYYKGRPAEKVSVQIFMHPDPLQLGYALAEEWLYWYAKMRSLGSAIDYWNSAAGCLDLLPQIHLRRIMWNMGAFKPDTEQARWADDAAIWIDDVVGKHPDQVDGVLEKLRPSPKNLFPSLAYATLTWPYAYKLPSWPKLVRRLCASGLVEKQHLSCFDHPAPKSWLKVGVTPDHWRDKDGSL